MTNSTTRRPRSPQRPLHLTRAVTHSVAGHVGAERGHARPRRPRRASPTAARAHGRAAVGRRRPSVPSRRRRCRAPGRLGQPAPRPPRSAPWPRWSGSAAANDTATCPWTTTPTAATCSPTTRSRTTRTCNPCPPSSTVCAAPSATRHPPCSTPRRRARPSPNTSPTRPSLPIPSPGPTGLDLAGLTDLVGAHGLGLIGPGADAAARALLVAVLTSGGTHDPDAQGSLVIPAPTLQRLLGIEPDQAKGPCPAASHRGP